MKLERGRIMRLETVQDALNRKNISFTYTEEDGCGSLDFMFRGLSFHVWEYHDNVWGAETNIYEAGRSIDVEGDYDCLLYTSPSQLDKRQYRMPASS